MTEKIIPTLIEKEMKESYLDYAMSVIVGRALPDIRDGLKPVHRRILYAMHDLGMHSTKEFKKCARIVGEILGKYHPHGDISVYDALVRLAQDFSLRYPLVKGQGNFGSVDADPAAAMRYTEAKLAKIADEMLNDIDKETVDFTPNFDGTTNEPLVLPAKLPNLLVNGSSGIAVGMATNIPPHNIQEIVDAVISLIENPELSIEELLNIVKGPDFPTGGQIIGVSGIKQAYKTGRGRIVLRSKHKLEPRKIIITEIPYQLNKSLLLEEIAKQVKEKVVEGISDLRDESDRDGMRIVIELKKDMNPETVLNQLYRHSQLQTSFGINIIALVDGSPKQLYLKACLDEYIKHRKEVVTRRTKFELKRAEERDHILQGLLIALKSIDDIVSLIKKSKDVAEAREGLITNYTLTEIQANAILDMKLSKLAALEQQKLLDEHNELIKFISKMREILASEKRIFEIIKDELIALKNEYSDKRRTEILNDEEEIVETEDLIEKKDVVITVTHSGYIKKQLLETYKLQKRGGRGVIGAETKDDNDFIEHLFVANTHSYILIFTDSGVVHWLRTHQIDESSRYAKGTAIINLIKLNENEKVTSMVAVDKFTEDHYLVMCTKKGIVKKTSLVEYSRPRQGGIIGINLRDNDKLVDVKLTDNTRQLIIATKDGRAVRFKESDVKSVGRNSIGVRGINVKTSEVIGMEIANAPYLLTVTENGYGKRSEVNDYRLISRGGSGVTNIKITEKNGSVSGIKIVNEYDEIMLISNNGVIIRTPIKGISVIGRNTQGVKIINLEDNDQLSTVARIINEEIDLEDKEEFKPEDVSDDTNIVIEGNGEDNSLENKVEPDLETEVILENNNSETIDANVDPVEVMKEELKTENIEVVEDREEEIKNIEVKEIENEDLTGDEDETLEENNVDNNELNNLGNKVEENTSKKKDFTLGGYE